MCPTVPPYQTCVHLVLCLQITDVNAWLERLDKDIGAWCGILMVGVYVCFFKVVSGIQRGLFFGSSSSGHVRVASPMMREEKRWRPVQERNCPVLGAILILDRLELVDDPWAVTLASPA